MAMCVQANRRTELERSKHRKVCHLRFGDLLQLAVATQLRYERPFLSRLEAIAFQISTPTKRLLVLQPTLLLTRPDELALVPSHPASLRLALSTVLRLDCCPSRTVSHHRAAHMVLTHLTGRLLLEL